MILYRLAFLRICPLILQELVGICSDAKNYILSISGVVYVMLAQELKEEGIMTIMELAALAIKTE